MKTEIKDGIPTISPEVLKSEIGKIKIVDVRRPEEYTGELGHIQTAQLVTLGPELETFLKTQDHKTPLVFVCKSGGRSAQATEYGMRLGFQHAYNMTGGMLLWNQLKLPTEK